MRWQLSTKIVDIEGEASLFIKIKKLKKLKKIKNKKTIVHINTA